MIKNLPGKYSALACSLIYYYLIEASGACP
jgi:hypothetical protein